MSITLTGINKSKVINTLDTYNHTTLSAGVYTVSCQINERPTSGITITIQNNSVTVVSTSAPASSQSLISLSASINCSLSDVLSVIVDSSTAHDKKPNDFKGIINIHQGMP